jgi:hypothetical protein
MPSILPSSQVPTLRGVTQRSDKSPPQPSIRALSSSVSSTSSREIEIRAIASQYKNSSCNLTVARAVFFSSENNKRHELDQIQIWSNSWLLFRIHISLGAQSARPMPHEKAIIRYVLTLNGLFRNSTQAWILNIEFLFLLGRTKDL